MKRITIGFSIHRPEIIPATADLMCLHAAVFLEEPPVPEFQEMLKGALPIDDYLLPLDVEYPEFSRGMCRLLQELYCNGKKLFQVEPYLQKLIEIHERFSLGDGPTVFRPESIEHQVYIAERNATRALIDYYQTVTDGSFQAAINAIIRFARLDAARFQLRDVLRAQALGCYMKTFASVYIEAGSIHYSLYSLLRNGLAKQAQIKPVFLAHQAIKTLGKKGHLYGPGDLLTLKFIFHPDLKGSQREALLAARSLIYTKLIEKEELPANLATFSHIRNELACIQMVNRLSLDDCGRLFPLIRRVKTDHARLLVEDYFAWLKKHAWPKTNRLAC